MLTSVSFHPRFCVQTISSSKHCYTGEKLTRQNSEKVRFSFAQLSPFLRAAAAAVAVAVVNRLD